MTLSGISHKKLVTVAAFREGKKQGGGETGKETGKEKDCPLTKFLFYSRNFMSCE